MSPSLKWQQLPANCSEREQSSRNSGTSAEEAASCGERGQDAADGAGVQRIVAVVDTSNSNGVRDCQLPIFNHAYWKLALQQHGWINDVC